MKRSPQNLCWNIFREFCACPIGFPCVPVFVLKVYRTEIRMILVAVPPTIEARVRVRVVDSIGFRLSSKPPLHFEYEGLRTGWRFNLVGSGTT